MSLKTRRRLASVLVIAVALSPFLIPANAWPVIGPQSGFAWASNSGTSSGRFVEGNSLGLILIAYASSSTTLLTGVNFTGGYTPQNIANCTESTSPGLTLELWYVRLPSTQAPAYLTATDTFSSSVLNGLATAYFANVTQIGVGLESAATSAVNGNSPQTAQVSVGGSTNTQREILAFSAAVTSTSSNGTNSFSIKLVGSYSPHRFLSAGQTATTTQQGAYANAMIERVQAGGDAIGVRYTISYSDPISACTIGLAVIPNPPPTTTTT